MDEILKITSLQNPKVKEALLLRDRRARDEKGLFLIEGYREISRFLKSGGKAIQLFFSKEHFLGENEEALIEDARREGAFLMDCAKPVFEKLSYRDRPDGLLAIARIERKGLDVLDQILQHRPFPFLVVAEAIEKPGNLGTILRSSDASGVDALIVADPCTDVFNPNVVRASVGTLFHVPVIEANSAQTIQWLKKRGIQIVAATPHATGEFTEANFKKPLAIAVGTEQLGLSSEWMEGADIQVKIPMLGIADSLNVATATTLLLYEVLRQRRHA